MLSSGRGPSGIAIIRISGKDTLKICKLISKEKKILSLMKLIIVNFMIQKTINYRSRSFNYYGFQNLIVLLVTI